MYNFLIPNNYPCFYLDFGKNTESSVQLIDNVVFRTFTLKLW